MVVDAVAGHGGVLDVTHRLPKLGTSQAFLSSVLLNLLKSGTIWLPDVLYVVAPKVKPGKNSL